MDGFGFGAVGGLFGSSASFSSITSDLTAVETKHAPEIRRSVTSETTDEWDNNDGINDFGFTRPLKRGVPTSSPAQGIVPIDVKLLVSSVKNAIESKSTSLTLYGQSITNVCIIGRVISVDTLPSMVVMVLEDDGEKFSVRSSKNSGGFSDGDLLSVVGAVIILSDEDYYVDSTHMRTVDDKFQEYHKVAVRFAAHSLDAATRLHGSTSAKAQTTILIDKESWKKVKLGIEYDLITDPAQVAVIKFLTIQNDKIASVAVIVKSLTDFQEEEVREAVDALVKQSEIGISGQLCFLP